jgi:hypothetical protein
MLTYFTLTKRPMEENIARRKMWMRNWVFGDGVHWQE